MSQRKISFLATRPEIAGLTLNWYVTTSMNIRGQYYMSHIESSYTCWLIANNRVQLLIQSPGRYKHKFTVFIVIDVFEVAALEELIHFEIYTNLHKSEWLQEVGFTWVKMQT